MQSRGVAVVDNNAGFAADMGAVLASALRSEGQRALFAWYSEVAGRKKGLPARADFDPIDFPAALPYLVLIDVEPSPRRFRVRLVGTAVVDARGHDDIGRYYDEAEGAAVMFERANQVTKSRRANFESGIAMTWSPKSYNKYSVLSLPLSSDGENVDMLMHCLEFE
jgi:hypothetical protein